LKLSNILYTLSVLLLILSAAFVAPLSFSVYYKDGLALVYAVQIAVMLLLGFALKFFIPKPTELTIREGFLTVALVWIILSLFGCIPFMASGYIPCFTDAFFETMSGFTTTGASILTDIEALPKSLLLWRDMTQWLGGMGVITLAVAIFPYLGTGGSQLFKAEVPGPIKDKISPRISETAKLLWFVYFIFTGAEIVLLMSGGVSFFESVCTSFGTMATGGFSPRNASIAAYSSAYVHYIVLIFMFIAGTNFSLHYWFLKGRLSSYHTNPEFRFFAGVIVTAFILIVVFRWMNGEDLSEASIRGSLFQTVSLITTTGFITEDYETWPFVTQIILVALMFVGGCTTSTGGGIKNIRIQILFKYLNVEIKKLFSPHGIFPVKIGDRPVPENMLSNILAFIALYGLIFFFGVLAMSGLGMDVVSSIGAAAATMGNIGPGLGSVGPVDNFAHIPALGKWVLSSLMMIGRLEIFTILVIFTRSFWR
jgi:trk system potassium uptake protein TrkH